MTPEPSPDPPGEPASKGFPWDLAFQAVGIVAGLAAWIALVGGAKLWARFNRANIEATQTIAGLPRELLVEEGLITLVVPILLGIAAAVIVLAWPDDWGDSDDAAVALAMLAGIALLLVVMAIAEVDFVVFGAIWVAAIVLGLAVWWFTRHREPRAGPAVFLVVVTLGTIYVFFDALTVPAVGAMLLITVIAIGLTLLALKPRPVPADAPETPQAPETPPTPEATPASQPPSRWRVALTLFVALALWAGALGYAQEAGDKTPKLVRADVFLKAGGDPLGGYLLGQAAQRLYLAQNTDGKVIEDDPIRHVVVLPDDAIAKVTYRKEDVLPEARKDENVGDDQTGPGPPPPGGDSTPTPTPTPDSGPPTDSGPGPGAADPESESLPLPPPDKRSAATIDGVRVEFHVLDVVLNGGILQLNAQLVNVSDVRGEPGSLKVGDALDDHDPANDRYTADKLELFDAEARDLFPVDHHGKGECACTQNLDSVVLEPGEAVRIWASFPVRNSGASKVDLTVPGFGWIRGVAVR